MISKKRMKILRMKEENLLKKLYYYSLLLVYCYCTNYYVSQTHITHYGENYRPEPDSIPHTANIYSEITGYTFVFFPLYFNYNLDVILMCKT